MAVSNAIESDCKFGVVAWKSGWNEFKLTSQSLTFACVMIGPGQRNQAEIILLVSRPRLRPRVSASARSIESGMRRLYRESQAQVRD